MKKIFLTLQIVVLSFGVFSQTPWTLTTVHLSTPVADAGLDKTVSLGNSTTIGTAAVGGLTYSWTSNPVGFTSTSAIPTVTPNIATTYYLEANNGTCIGYDTVFVNVTGTTLALTKTTNPGTICSGISSTLSIVPQGGTGTYTYSWNEVGNATVLSTNDTLVVSPSSAVVNTFRYHIALNDGVSTVNDTLDVVVNPLPLADAGLDKTVSLGNSTTIGTAAIGGLTYSWTSNPVGFTSTSAIPTVTPNVATTYYLEVSNGTCIAYDTVFVNITGTTLALTKTTNPAIICSGTSSILSIVPQGGTGTYTYSWNEVGNATVLSTNDTLVVSPSSAVVNTFRYHIALNDGVSTINDTLDVVVNPLPLNQVPNVSEPVVAGVANVCGLTTGVIIGLNATQSNYIYELYDVNTSAIIDAVTSPVAPVDGPVQFTPQTVDRTFGIRVRNAATGCTLIIHN